MSERQPKAVANDTVQTTTQCRAGVIPLLGEMSAKQTKGCRNSGEFAPAEEICKNITVIGCYQIEFNIIP